MKDSLDKITVLRKTIEHDTQLIGRNQRLSSGVRSTRVKGFMTGFIVTLVIVAIPIIIGAL